LLFVATQGGRPPVDPLPDRRAAVVRRRRQALRLWDEGRSVSEVCTVMGCGRASLFRWRERFAADGLAGLLDRYRSVRESDLPPEIERLVLTVRMLTYWNSQRIAAELRRREIWPLSNGHVARLLCRFGTHRSSFQRVPGPRYERAAANELWHIDLKGPFYLGARPRRSCHFIALVDDFSRFLLGIHALPTKEALPIIEFLEQAVELCGTPLALMSDNGTPFVAIVRTMLSRFRRTLEDLQVRQIRTQIDTPWTNGKIEAFWATLQAEVLDRQQIGDLAAADAAVSAYAGYYNYHRLHGEIGWHTPAERFNGTPFTDRGFENIPALAGVAQLLSELAAAT